MIAKRVWRAGSNGARCGGQQGACIDGAERLRDVKADESDDGRYAVHVLYGVMARSTSFRHA